MTAAAHLTVLAAPQDPTLEPGGSAGYLALLLVVVLFLATVLLIRNMSGRLKRLPRDFPDQAPPAPGDTPVTPGPADPS